MKTIHLFLLALLLGLSACSFSFSSGPGAYAMDPGSYPGSMAMVHGPGKPARRVDATAPQVAHKPARADPAPTPAKPAKQPTRVGRKDPARPKVEWAGTIPPATPSPRATFVGKIPTRPAPKATFVGKLPAKPKPAPKATFVGKLPTEPAPVPLTAPKFDWVGEATPVSQPRS